MVISKKMHMQRRKLKGSTMKKMLNRSILLAISVTVLTFLFSTACNAEEKKGLLVYDSIYGSTPEVAYWIKAIIGNEQPLDVKRIDQVITVAPYDYVLIGSYSKWEKPSPRIYEFVEKYQNELSNKQVCYFLTCGDWDETMILQVPGRAAHQIAGRNYLFELMTKYPNIKPVVIGGFGGRQVKPALHGADAFMIWMLEKLAKEGAAWSGLDIYESLVPERVEVFGNDVRQKALGLEPLTDVQKYRGFWQSQQPGSLTDPSKKKYTVRPYTVHTATDKLFYSRSRIKNDLDGAIQLLAVWAQQNGIKLNEQRKTFFNVYYHAVKNVNGKDMTLHVVAATFPDDPGNVHLSLRSYDKPDVRKPMEEAIAKAELVLWADGRKVEGR
jgi:menaquinone-dependent protoporphyrinogen IX oxidase